MLTDIWTFPCLYHGSQHASLRRKVVSPEEPISWWTDVTAIGLVAAGHYLNLHWMVSLGALSLQSTVFSAARALPATSLLAAKVMMAVSAISRESMYSHSSSGTALADRTRHVDSYHTCYVLAGLSAAQHHHYRTDSSTVSEGFSSAFSWKSSPSHAEDSVFSEGDGLAPLHPLYLIPHKDAEKMRRWSEDHPLA